MFGNLTRQRQVLWFARMNPRVVWAAGGLLIAMLVMSCRSVSVAPNLPESSQTAEPSAEALARYAGSVLSELGRDEEGALAHLLAGIEADPDNIHLHERAALLLVRRGRRSEAIRLAEQWVQRRPHHPVRLRLWAKLLESDGRLDEAMTAFRRAVESDPEDAVTAGEWALFLLRRDNGVAAVAALKQAAPRARPVAALIQSAQACLIWIESGDHKEVRAALEDVLIRLSERMDLDATTALALGRLLHRVDRIPEALALFDRAAALDPGDETSALFAALMRAVLGREEEALSVAEQAVDRVRRPVNLLRLIADLRVRAAARAPDASSARPHFLAAAAALRRASAARPDDLPLRFSLVEALIRGGSSEEALREVRRTAEGKAFLKPLLALRFAVDGDYGPAIRRLEELAGAAPDSALLHYILGELRLHAGDRHAAIEAFHRAAFSEQTEPLYFVRLAAAQAFESEAAAMDTLREAAARWPDDLSLIEARARLLEFIGDYPQACAVYETLKKRMEENEEAEEIPLALEVRIAAAQALSGEVPAAAERLRFAIASDPSAFDLFIHLTADPDHPEEAIDHARTVLRRLDAERADTRSAMYRGLFEHFTGNYDDAVAAFEIARARAEKALEAETWLTPDFYFWYGAALERSGRIAEAEAMLLKTIEMAPDHHRALNYLAYTWADRGRHLERALELIQRALQHEPENGAYIDTLAWIHFRMGKVDLALEELRRALEKEPEESEIVEHIGDALEALGRPQEALEYFRRAYVLAPDRDVLREKLIARGVAIEPLAQEAEQRRLEKRRERRWRRFALFDEEAIAAPPAESENLPGSDLTPEELEEIENAPLPL